MASPGKFSLPAETHYFPVAGAGAGAGAALCVSVRSLPRSEEPPLLLCSHGQGEEQEEEVGEQGDAAPPAPPPPDSQDLRRCLGRALTDIPPCGGSRPLTKSDSLDSMLGDSLLDPPQTRARMTPRRYQSPSRCGSPSHEAPEPLYSHQPPSYTDTMAGRGMASSSSSVSEPDSRLARHDLLRRRDLSLFHGLHPRVLTVSPRLSLPPRGTPCRALAGAAAGAVAGVGAGAGESPHTDRLPGTCTRQGKHVCEEHEVDEGEREEQEDEQNQEDKERPEEQEEGEDETRSTPSPPASAYQQAELGAKQKGWSSRGGRGGRPYSRDSSAESGEGREGKEEREGRVGYRPCRDADYGGMEQAAWGMDRDMSPR